MAKGCPSNWTGVQRWQCIWQNPESPGGKRAAEHNNNTVCARSKAYRSHREVFSHSLPQGVVMCPPCVCGQDVPVKHPAIQHWTSSHLWRQSRHLSQTSILVSSQALVLPLRAMRPNWSMMLNHLHCSLQEMSLSLYWGRQFKKSSGAWSQQGLYPVLMSQHSGVLAW